MSETFGEVIFSYTRAQAIEDGELVDVSKLAREAGIKFPVAVSRAVWARYCEVPDGTVGQDVNGRTWDVVWMFRAVARRFDGAELSFKLHVAMPDRGDWRTNEAPPEQGSSLRRETHRLVTLKAVCGPGAGHHHHAARRGLRADSRRAGSSRSRSPTSGARSSPGMPARRRPARARRSPRPSTPAPTAGRSAETSRAAP